MIRWLKKLRAKWILYRIRHCKRYKRTIKVSTTKDELKQAFTDPKALDRYMAEIINRYYDEANKDFIRLRLEAGEIVTSGDDDIGLYPDVFDKYKI